MNNNPFEYSSDNKRYLTQNYYLQKRFGKKVIKLSLNCGFSCPNRDGLKGSGGCTYCSSDLSGDYAGNPAHSVLRQLEEQKELMSSKWHDGYYIPYFQAGSNTYAPVGTLRKLFYTALEFENTVGLAVATRADCINDECLDLLSELSEKTYLVVELGLQTIHDVTANHINRCHSYAEFLETYRRLTDRNINVCIHIINGLPLETPEMMMQTASEISRLKPHSLKIHMLHIIKNTDMYREYLEKPFHVLNLEEYIEIVCNQLEILPPETIIQRVTGDGKKETLFMPEWTLKKFVVMNEIDKEMKRRNSWQGKKYKE